MSPALSLGVNENGVRHCGQKPSARPGRPSRDRPTGDPQLGQNRRSSGTCGSRIIAFSGSIVGAGGTVVSPAPSRAPRSRVDDVPTLRVVRDPAARADPIGVLASRLDDDVTRLRVEPAPASAPEAWPPADCSGIPLPDAGAAGPVAVGEDEPPATTGAPAGVPQTSQYPSAIVPVQPGWVHF
jgi:hypothetical protein